VPDRLTALAIATDPDAQTGEPGAEYFDQRLEPLWPPNFHPCAAVSARTANPDHRRSPECAAAEPCRTSPRQAPAAALVHVRERFDDDGVTATVEQQPRVAPLGPFLEMPAARQFLDDDEPDVVPGARIFGPGVAESDDEPKVVDGPLLGGGVAGSAGAATGAAAVMAASSDAVREPSTATTTVSAGVISVKPAGNFTSPQ